MFGWYVGNRASLGRLKSLLGEPGPLNLLITGESGTGKTALAKEVALALSDELCIFFYSPLDFTKELLYTLNELGRLNPPNDCKQWVVVLDDVDKAPADFLSLLPPLLDHERICFVLTASIDFNHFSIIGKCYQIRLSLLNLEETKELIAKKLGKKLANRKSLVELIFAISRGNPREVLKLCREVKQYADLDTALINLQEHYYLRRSPTFGKLAKALFSQSASPDEIVAEFNKVKDKLVKHPEEVRLFLYQAIESAILSGQLDLRQLLENPRSVEVFEAINKPWVSFLDVVQGIVKIRKCLKER